MEVRFHIKVSYANQETKKKSLIFTAFLDFRIKRNVDTDTKHANNGSYLYNGYYMLDSSLSIYILIHLILSTVWGPYYHQAYFTAKETEASYFN